MNKENEISEPLVGSVLLDKEALSEILTQEFFVKGYIPGHFKLEITEMEIEDEVLELSLTFHEGYIN